MKSKPTTIPLPLREKLSKDPFYQTCAKAGQPGHECRGKITWEHALYYKGSKVQEGFALVPLCEYGHGVNTYQDGGDMVKTVNEWIALSLATPEERLSISKAENKEQRLKYLESLYGKYDKEAAMSAFEKTRRERGFMRGDVLYIGEASPVMDMDLAAPGSKDKTVTKKFWYSLSTEEIDVVKTCMAFYKKEAEITLTPFEMIKVMIIEHGQRIEAHRYANS